MAKLDAPHIAGLIVQCSGWPFDSPANANTETFTAIALAESSGNTEATHRNVNGTVDRGLFQINSIHKQYDSERLLSDPQYNAQAAVDIWNGAGQKFTPWSTYNTGAYLTRLPGVKSSIGGSVKGKDDAHTDTKTPFGTIPANWIRALDVITSLSFWERVGIVLLGIAALGFGGYLLFGKISGQSGGSGNSSPEVIPV